MKGEAFPKVIAIQRLEMWVTRAYSGGQVVKNLPARHEPQETPAQCLCLENHLEESMAIHSNILAWRIPQTEELGGLQSIVSQIVGHDWNNIARAHTHMHTHRGRMYLGLWHNDISKMKSLTSSKIMSYLFIFSGNDTQFSDSRFPSSTISLIVDRLNDKDQNLSPKLFLSKWAY